IADFDGPGPVKHSNAQGQLQDAAINITGTGISVVGFRNGILWSNYSGLHGMDPVNGVLLATQGSANVKGFVDFSSYTCGGTGSAAWKSTNITMDCAGNIAAALVNVGTGFRIASAATSGHYLRGDGTNYVDGTIAVGDLPTGGADRILGNFSGATAAPTYGALLSCSTASSALTYNTATHAFGCNSITGGGGTPGGSSGDVQYNNAGAFGGLTGITTTTGTV